MKKFVLFVITLSAIALVTCLICQYVHFVQLDHALQLETVGFVKNDVTMLNWGQQFAKNSCLLGAIGVVLVYIVGVVAFIF